MEPFRKNQKDVRRRRSSLTILPPASRLLRTLAARTGPTSNVSLAPNGKQLIHKITVSFGFAVDTPDGLMVR